MTPQQVDTIRCKHFSDGRYNQTVYTQRANGTDEYWTYCDGDRVFISKAYASRLINQGEKLVKLY